LFGRRSVRARPNRKRVLGWYLPFGEPRPIPDGAILRRSVIDRIAKVPAYRPFNMPASYSIEEMPPTPVADAGAGP
jgi:hypothetical protein